MCIDTYKRALCIALLLVLVQHVGESQHTK